MSLDEQRQPEEHAFSFRKRAILVPATITSPMLSPFTAALTRWCSTDEIIRGAL
jgi:hypothetical protein